MQCPVSRNFSKEFINYKGKKVSYFSKIYNVFNFFGLKIFGRAWLLQYFGEIYPGIIAHYKNKNLTKDFYNETIACGEQASTFYEKIGIRKFAEENGGICTFWMGGKPVLYQIKNIPLLNDNCLSPSTGPNQRLFGEFMGTLSHDNPARKKKRQPLLNVLTNPDSLQELIPFIKKHARDFLLNSVDKEYLLEEFCINLVAHIDSFLPGILDIHSKPLTAYLNSNEYGKVIRDFFELASDVISKLDTNALDLVQSVAPFVRDLISSNLVSIKQAPETNIIKQYFALAGYELTSDAIANIPDDFFKELATIIIALYDTTSLSLYWLICFIEQNPQIKENIIEESKNEFDINNISYIELAIIEAIRLAGNNPTALWREVIAPTEVIVKDISVLLRKGTMLWLDRRAANQDNEVFPNPSDYDPSNIQAILKEKSLNIFSILSNNRYEINSFSMVNTNFNPRKCPGRYFSILVQSFIIRTLYGNYDITSEGTVTKLRKYCSMPRPDNQARIYIKKSKGAI